MPYNLLLLPIIIGYISLIYSLFFKYNSQRLSRSRILFESIALGVIIVSFGFVIRTIIQLIFPTFIPWTIDFLKIVPINKTEYFWTFIFSSLLALIFIFLSNKFIRKKFPNDIPIGWAVDKNGDEIEKLFKKSVEEGLTIQVTLKNDKVYIGFSETIPIPQKTNYLTLSPIISGYRDKETKRLVITTEYFKVVDEFIKELKNDEDSVTLNTDVIIKQDEILSAGIYEQRIYDLFNKTKQPVKPKVVNKTKPRK